MRKREFEILGEELLNVWALDVIGLLELDDFEDLYICENCLLASPSDMSI